MTYLTPLVFIMHLNEDIPAMSLQGLLYHFKLYR